MAIASNFILNAGSEAGQYRIYPWISKSVPPALYHNMHRVSLSFLFVRFVSVSNIAAVQDSLQGVDVPDVAAGDALDAFVPPETVTETEGEGEGATTTAGVERAQTCLASRFEPLVPARWRDRLAQQKQQQQHQQEQEEQQLQQQLQQQQARSTFPRFSMATGDFVEIYTNLKAEQHLPQLGRRCVDGSTGVVFTDSSLATDSGAAQWDAVVTCFFLDTAPVVLE